MLKNDGVTERHRLTLGQRVNFRWSRTRYRGVIQRLAETKALIRFPFAGGEKVEFVAYRQIEESDRYRPPEGVAADAQRQNLS